MNECNRQGGSSQAPPVAVAVLGMGNELMGDDGVGVHAVRLLRAQAVAGLDCYEIGTAVLGRLDVLEAYDRVIAIDAVCAGGVPGSVYCLDGTEAAVATGHSLHDLGLPAALALLEPSRRPEVRVVGVEPECLAPGTALSGTVEQVLPRIVECVKAQAARLAVGAERRKGTQL